MPKVNYVIACWSGPRLTDVGSFRYQEPADYLRTHLHYLNRVQHSLSQITIVHPSFELIPIEYQALLDTPSLINGTPIKALVVGSNENLSYGSWEEAYKEYRTQFDYYIFVEDDYVPVLNNFDQVLINMIEEKQAGYLGAQVSPTKCVENMPHMGVTNGIIKSDVLEAVFQKFGGLFTEDAVIPAYLKDQLNFSYAFVRSGFVLADYADRYSIPFWYAHRQTMMDFSPDHEECIFMPYQDPRTEKIQHDCPHRISIRPMKEHDLEFLLEVRNECRNWLRDDRTFTFDECLQWFREQKPRFYMIIVNDVKVGYFRTSAWDEKHRRTMIGADIHEAHRGCGYAYEAYKIFMDYLFKVKNMNKISLDVLATNERARALYIKLGFVHEGIKRQEIYRDGQFVDSYVMSILKSEWNDIRNHLK